MSSRKIFKVALLGNPNAGKTSLFNHLTGLHQKVGNFPGVTVDKKTGKCRINENFSAEIIDLPGIYSLYPKSPDEKIVFDYLHENVDTGYPDLLIVIVDASNLKRNMLLFTQIRDLGFPVILALNMTDVAERTGTKTDAGQLAKDLQVPVVEINARTGKGVDGLKAAIACPVHNPPESYLKPSELAPGLIEAIKKEFDIKNDYLALQLAHQHENMASLSEKTKERISQLVKQHAFDSRKLQSKETISRYEVIHRVISNAVSEMHTISDQRLSDRIDRILTHRVYGYLIFFFILFLIFQAIFAWAAAPMDLIDSGIAALQNFLQSSLPQGPLLNLLTEGLIAGLGGVLIFIPQIAILFGFISLLEESGYMSRVMFLMDKIMRKFGMSGKSVVPLISGVACAVPAIMSSRNIENRKDRLVTIFVTPLMSCSARIPVFTILIALVIPEEYILGIFNLQGLALMGLYLLGFLSAIISGLILNLILKTDFKSYFIMEFPAYKLPRWKNMGFLMMEKVKAFVFEAGKIIVAISIILWVLASYGPGDSMDKAEEKAILEAGLSKMPEEETLNLISSRKLESSYAGVFGKTIEPVIKPLGFDWKIGIALLTSFAAREVFIGTMATIYSVGSDDNATIKERMKEEKDPATGMKRYTPALAFSLLIFYLFAMQCMSTLAVVYKETKSWKWPAIQFFYMTGLAYFFSYLVYQVMK